MSRINFIAYSPEYFSACLEIFDTNVGDYFALHERDDFIKFLDTISQDDQYYVGLFENKPVCCGGWKKQDRGYFLRWGMLDKNYHRLGMGQQLLEFRLESIASQFGSVDVLITTSNKAQGFFEHYGFIVEKKIANGISQGIDEVHMRKPAK